MYCEWKIIMSDSYMVDFFFLLFAKINGWLLSYILQVDRWNEQRENGIFPGPL